MLIIVILYRKTMKPPEERLKACRTKHVRTCSETRKLFLGIPVLHPNHLGQKKNAKRRVASVQSYQSGSSSTIVCATMQLHVSNLENQKKGRGTAGRPIFMEYLPTIPGISIRYFGPSTYAQKKYQNDSKCHTICCQKQMESPGNLFGVYRQNVKYEKLIKYDIL